MTYYLSWLKCRIMLYAPFFPGWSGWFKLSLSGMKKKKRKIQQDSRPESSWYAGRAACEWGSRYSQRSAPCCFSQGNVSGREGSTWTCSPICSSNGPDWQIGFFSACSCGAIGETGLHMQMTWKWHKHVDTRIGFISAAGPKVNPGLVLVILQAFFLIISPGRWCLTCGMSVAAR